MDDGAQEGHTTLEMGNGGSGRTAADHRWLIDGTAGRAGMWAEQTTWENNNLGNVRSGRHGMQITVFDGLKKEEA